MASSVCKGDIVYVVRAPLTNSDKQQAKLDGINMATFRHYGIAVGDHTVIHFVGSSGYFSGDKRIRHTSMSEFAKGASVEVDTYIMKQKAYSSDEIVSRAKGYVGSDFGGYRLLKNNCEHFANWAVTGKKVSRQALLLGGNREQDIVTNAIDRTAAAVDKVFDPLIEFGDKLDKAMGWGKYKYDHTNVTIGDRVKQLFRLR